MSPIYESETVTREDLDKLRKKNQCLICGGMLDVFWDMEKNKAFLACHDFLRTQHEGIGKPNRAEDKSYEGGIRQMTQVEQEHGLEKTRQLIKYQGATSLTRQQAMEIMDVIWPDAPSPDKVAAAILCASYGLNPLANHVFLIPFKDKAGKKTWARVWGIKAKRLLASRKGGYSYLDMTPRLMTEEEQVKVWGGVDADNLCYITWLKDTKTGAEVYGYGKWPKINQPYGLDKGNTQANMASIRSESQALDRLRPAEMPIGFAIADEQYIEGESRVIDETTGEIAEPEPASETTEQDSSLVKEESSAVAPDEVVEAVPDIGKDMLWVRESLKQVKWTEPTIKSYLANIFKVSKEGTLEEVIARLSQEQKVRLVKEIQDRLDMKGG